MDEDVVAGGDEITLDVVIVEETGEHEKVDDDSVDELVQVGTIGASSNSSCVGLVDEAVEHEQVLVEIDDGVGDVELVETKFAVEDVDECVFVLQRDDIETPAGHQR